MANNLYNRKVIAWLELAPADVQPKNLAPLFTDFVSNECIKVHEGAIDGFFAKREKKGSMRDHLVAYGKELLTHKECSKGMLAQQVPAALLK